MERRERNPNSQSGSLEPHRMWKIDEREFTQSAARLQWCVFEAWESLTLQHFHEWISSYKLSSLLKTHHRRLGDVIRLLARDAQIIHEQKLLLVCSHQMPQSEPARKTFQHLSRCWCLYLNILLEERYFIMHFKSLVFFLYSNFQCERTRLATHVTRMQLN